MQLTVRAPSIWLASNPVDFRKSLQGLSLLVLEEFGRSPQEGIYIFMNRTRDRIKVLGWHKNGFILLYKKLEKGHFKLTLTSENNLAELSVKQLSWLIAGLDWPLMSACDELEFGDYF